VEPPTATAEHSAGGRGSIALSALPGAELDVASSLLKFHARAFEPMVWQRHWWNVFMFAAYRRWFILFGLLILAVAGPVDLLYDPNDVGIVAFSVCLNFGAIAFIVFLGTHWLDRRLAWEALCGFESVFCLANILVYNLTVLWLAAPSDVPNALSYATSAVGNTIAVLVVITSDAVPRALMSLRTRQLMFAVGALLVIAIWLRAGVFTSPTSADVCIVVCMPLLRVQASAAFNLAVFLLRFCASLSLWPGAAVILRTRLYLE
jgi:hypothetical protein